MRERIIFSIFLLASGTLITGCASLRSFFAINRTEKPRPIANPFADYRQGRDESAQTIVLRTKKGDRSVEIELPGNGQMLSDFVLPVSPAFKDTDRTLASSGISTPSGLDETYKNRSPSIADREIVQSLPKGKLEEEGIRSEIEQGLFLGPGEENSEENSGSYLAGLDKIKQLYKLGRFEAALLETDSMLKIYHTDPRLYEMRGTLYDRLGNKDLALKAWNQALRFNPNNTALQQFVMRKQPAATVGKP